MAYCPSCGEEVATGAAFCSECGESIEDPTSDETSEDTSIGGANPDETGSADLKMESEGRDYGRIGKAIGFALIPSFIAYMMLSLATGGDPVGIVFLLSLPLFAYLIYQRPTGKAMAGGMCYYLAIEFLLSPFVFLLYTIAFADQNTSTAAGQAGAAIGGFVLVIAAFVIGLPLALALYMVSRRLDVKESEGASTGTAA